MQLASLKYMNKNLCFLDMLTSPSQILECSLKDFEMAASMIKESLSPFTSESSISNNSVSPQINESLQIEH